MPLPYIRAVAAKILQIDRVHILCGSEQESACPGAKPISAFRTPPVRGKGRSPPARVCVDLRLFPPVKHACLEAFAAKGFALPDTPTMALHRASIDLMAEHLRRDSGLLVRRFTLDEIYPQSLGIAPGDGLHGMTSTIT